MTEEEKRTDLIDRYLKNQLAEEERSSFERQLETDVELQKELELQRSITLQLESIGKDQLRSKINALAEKPAGGNQRVVRLIAAVLILGILTVPAYFLLQSDTTPAQLADEYLQAYPDRITTMSAEQEDLSQAMHHYSLEEYEQAIPLFESIADDSSNLIPLYLSISYLRTGKMTDAVELLEAQLKHPKLHQSALHETYEWYLILAYLASGDKQTASQLLDDYIAAGYTYNQGKAESLSNELNDL